MGGAKGKGMQKRRDTDRTMDGQGWDFDRRPGILRGACLGKGAEVGRTRNCLGSNAQSGQAGGPGTCMKATGDRCGTGARGPRGEGLECQAEELGFGGTRSSREPWVALEQRHNEEDSNQLCVSYLQSARLFSKS